MAKKSILVFLILILLITLTTIITTEKVYFFENKINKSNKLEENEIVLVEEIKINKDFFELYIGETEEMSITILPENATNKNYTITALNNESVKFEGTTINGHAVGETDISIKSEDGNYEKIIKAKVFNHYSVHHISNAPKEMFIGETKKIELVFSPEQPSFIEIDWTSSNEDIATIDENGNIKGIKPGIVTITAAKEKYISEDKSETITSSCTVRIKHKYEEGSGTEDDPYIITDYYGLEGIKNYPYSYFELANNIDLTNETRENGIYYNKGNGWVPLMQESQKNFTGTLDGKGFTISGIKQVIKQENNNDLYYSGLFGRMDGTIKNIKIDDYSLKFISSIDETTDYSTIVGIGIIGSNTDNANLENIEINGTIETIYESGQIPMLEIGGLFGTINNSKLKNINSNINITQDESIKFTTGGIASQIQNSELTKITNLGTIKGLSSAGIASTVNNSTITETKNYGTLHGKAAAGIALVLTGTIKNSSNHGTLEILVEKLSKNGHVDIGGLVGYLSLNEGKSSIENSYNAGKIKIKTVKSHTYVGGIAGRIFGNQDDGSKPVYIKNSYNIGEIYITPDSTFSNDFPNNWSSTDIGGIASGSSAHIENCYNFGNIINQYHKYMHNGEIVADITRKTSDNSSGTVENAYFIDKGLPAVFGTNGSPSLITHALTFKEASTKEAYKTFDFEKTWEFKSNYPFPQLKENPQEGEYINNIEITNTEEEILSQQEIQLNYTITPSNYTKNEIIFEIIEGNNLATIDENGKLNLNGKGKIKVRIKSKNVHSINTTKEFNLIIIEDINKLEIKTISKQKYTGKEIKPEIKIYENEYQLINGKDFEVEYSNNINPGEATATITGKGLYKGTITKSFNIYSPLERIELNKNSGEVELNGTEQLKVSFFPENTTDDKTITWQTSNMTIATANKNGVVTAHGIGTATITAKVGNKTATYTINVINPLKSIKFNKEELHLDINTSEKLLLTITPSNTTDDTTVIWQSANENIAVVDRNGLVTAKNFGTTTITAKIGEKIASCIVTVNKYPITNIILNKTKGSLIIGQTEQLTATIYPNNTTDDKTITWSSSDNTIATVENGLIRALKKGTTIIIAKIGTKTASYKLEVIESINLTKILTNSGLKITNGNIIGFKLGDSISNIKKILGNNISINTKYTKISTGAEISYNSERMTVVIYGDLNGDGDIDSADLLKMRQHLLGKSKLNGAYKEAGSVTHSSTIDSADLLRMRQHLLGTKKIEQ